MEVSGPNPHGFWRSEKGAKRKKTRGATPVKTRDPAGLTGVPKGSGPIYQRQAIEKSSLSGCCAGSRCAFKRRRRHKLFVDEQVEEAHLRRKKRERQRHREGARVPGIAEPGLLLGITKGIAFSTEVGFILRLRASKETTKGFSPKPADFNQRKKNRKPRFPSGHQGETSSWDVSSPAGLRVLAA